jgi:uridine kinase
MSPLIVGIAGGSGAGKTALARAVAAALAPRSVALLAHDAYYVDRSHLAPPERAALDFDAPEALDHERFRADLDALRQGRSIVPPVYCFTTHRRLGYDAPLEPRELVLVEGVLLFHDAAVRAVFDLRVWIDAPDALRLARRIARDTAERGRTAESVVAQCRARVLPAHERHVEPTKAWADLVLLNAGRLEPVVEVATAVIRDRLERRRNGQQARAA